MKKETKPISTVMNYDLSCSVTYLQPQLIEYSALHQYVNVVLVLGDEVFEANTKEGCHGLRPDLKCG